MECWNKTNNIKNMQNLSSKQQTVFNNISFQCENGFVKTATIVLDYRQKSGVKLATLESLKKHGLITFERVQNFNGLKVYECQLVPQTKMLFATDPANIIKQNSTHHAFINTIDNTIEIWTIGMIMDPGQPDELTIKPDYCHSIPMSRRDDLFAIFEQYDEDNRINRAEYENEITSI